MATVKKEWGKPSKFSINVNGVWKEIGEINADTTDEAFCIDSDVAYPHPLPLEFTATLNYDKKEFERLQRKMAREIEKQISEYHKVLEPEIEKILRTRVKPPIKGEITKGKVKWRGLSLVWAREGVEILGVGQRGILYCVDGKDYIMKNEI
jgi:hypothetical protein